MHATCALACMQLGKHVYVEKPLTRTPWEARLLVQAAEKYHVATQMGNQGYSHDATRVACEILWSGEIGDVHEVHAWSGRPSWPQGMTKIPPPSPIPDTLDWDLWLGGAAERSFTQGDAEYEAFVTARNGGRRGGFGGDNGFYLPFNWRGFYDFGTSLIASGLPLPFPGCEHGRQPCRPLPGLGPSLQRRGPRLLELRHRRALHRMAGAGRHRGSSRRQTALRRQERGHHEQPRGERPSQAELPQGMGNQPMNRGFAKIAILAGGCLLSALTTVAAEPKRLLVLGPEAVARLIRESSGRGGRGGFGPPGFGPMGPTAPGSQPRAEQSRRSPAP